MPAPAAVNPKINHDINPKTANHSKPIDQYVVNFFQNEADCLGLDSIST